MAVDRGGVELNVAVEYPALCPTVPGAPGYEWCCPTVPSAPTLDPPTVNPMAAPVPDDPVAVQKTLATICDGVMPTTGTLALG